MKFVKGLSLLGSSLALIFFFMNCKPSSSNSTAQTPAGANDFNCVSNPVAKGSRQFGMDILKAPTTGTYEDNFVSLKTLRAQFQTLHFNWSDIEGVGNGVTPGPYTDPYNGLSDLNRRANENNIKVTLRIHPIDVPGKKVPSDLDKDINNNNIRFNDPILKTRAKAMLDFVFSRISPANVTHLVLGNEIDGYNPGADNTFWWDYADFLFAMKAHLLIHYPTVQLGFVITARGATDPTLILPSSGNQKAVDIFTGWMGVVDLVGVTYYPLSPTFTMNPIAEVSQMFQKLVGFTNKPIHIEEIGSSSSTANSGSENLQAEFFCEVFKAWDTHAAKIPSLAVLRMVDTSRAVAEQTASDYKVPGNENFIEYIRSLGIRTEDNKPKLSYKIIDSELQKRGF